ncbi:MAG: hypothetical protein QOI66_3851 [Myxococcales bacterium]|jgi:hypothetical protein|nr:hypothetical protein [Myxococcales bacterium]
MKTLLPVAVIFGLLPPAVAGCDTHTLVGREWPAGSGGSPDASPPEMSTTPGNNDASPSFVDPGTLPGKDEDAAPSYDASTPDAGPPLNVDPPFSIPERLVGEWTGYFQAYQLRSGSDAITIDLVRRPGQSDFISITLGSGPAPMMSGSDPLSPVTMGKPERFSPEYFESFSYTAHQVKWRDTRLTFQIAIAEPYGPWCGTQKSFFDPRYGTYNCIPGTGGTYDPDSNLCLAGSDEVVVPCPRYWACLAHDCDCGANGCVAAVSPLATFDVTFEPFVSGATDLDGSHSFRLTRTVTDGGAPESGQ